MHYCYSSGFFLLSLELKEAILRLLLSAFVEIALFLFLIKIDNYSHKVFFQKIILLYNTMEVVYKRDLW